MDDLDRDLSVRCVNQGDHVVFVADLFRWSVPGVGGV